MPVALHVPSLRGERALQRAQSWVRAQPGPVGVDTRLPARGCGPGTVMPFYLGVSVPFSRAAGACHGGRVIGGLGDYPMDLGGRLAWAPE